MRPQIDLNYKNFRIAIVISVVVAAVILSLSFYLGKNEFFLLLNNDYGKASDYFFKYLTNLGDGLLWILWLAGIFVTKRKRLLPLIISAFILTTIFTQFFKYVILPDEARPSKAITDISKIHFIEGVHLHSINSFPSGHTATAFTFVLLMALTVRRKGVMLLAIIVALLVGYSRIYLAQHFPLDVGAGILIAVCSVSISTLIFRYFGRKNI
jgi:membrane-associated phospholipid phosphatase